MREAGYASYVNNNVYIKMTNKPFGTLLTLLRIFYKLLGINMIVLYYSMCCTMLGTTCRYEDVCGMSVLCPSHAPVEHKPLPETTFESFRSELGLGLGEGWRLEVV